MLDLWKQDQLTTVETLLTAAIATSQETNHHLLATRALVRTRMQEWDTAIIDAERVCCSALIYTHSDANLHQGY